MLKKQKTKKIFITGATGLLGHYLIKTTPETYDISCTIFPASKKDSFVYDCEKYYLDISDRHAVSATIKKIKPDCVIHTASIAGVDYVEKNKEEAEKINLGGTLNVIKACQDIGDRLIYISSNAVFDGENPPYSEDDAVNPINYYGKLKVKEEEAFRKSGLKGVIVRPILMYGWNLDVERKNPVTWLIDMLKKNEPVDMVDDIFCNPLYAKDCADTIWKIIELEKEGIFHVGGGDEVSRYDFARITAEVFGLNHALITPVKNSCFKDIAPRPINTTYCTDKIKRELNIFPLGLRDGLEKMKNEIT